MDHSALDSYMFCIKVSGKTILFTGDFREHGIVGQQGRLERVLKKYVPGPVDILITEGTMLSRAKEVEDSLVKSEQELGKEAGKLFQEHKYNFVLVSSTNLDSIMGFYHHTPKEMHFVCDLYQAQVLITAMADMEAKGRFPAYWPSREHPVDRTAGGPGCARSGIPWRGLCGSARSPMRSWSGTALSCWPGKIPIRRTI